MCIRDSFGTVEDVPIVDELGSQIRTPGGRLERFRFSIVPEKDESVREHGSAFGAATSGNGRKRIGGVRIFDRNEIEAFRGNRRAGAGAVT